jgi:hypothetical protein
VFDTAPGSFPQGFSFAHKDWELACDNTGTCRAAGYGATMGEVSVLLTRNAGAAQHVIAVATFAQTERDIPRRNGKCSLTIGITVRLRPPTRATFALMTPKRRP